MVVQNTSTQKSLQVGVGILAAAAAIALLYFGRVFLYHRDHRLDDRFSARPFGSFLHEAAHAARPGQFRGVQHRARGLVSRRAWDLYLQGQQIAADLPAYGARINEMVDSVASAHGAV